MKQRIIAGVFLVGFLAGNVAAAWAISHQLTAKPTHSCCLAHRRAVTPPSTAMLGSKTVPCEEHPCCAKQGPESPAILSSAVKMSRLDSESAVAVVTSPDGKSAGRISAGIVCTKFETPPDKSTVLRI